MRGTVSEQPWGMTLGALGSQQFSGQLLVQAEGKQYGIAFDQGDVIGATSPAPADAVARIALTAHLVSSSQVPDLMRRLTAAPERQDIDVLAEAVKLGADQVRDLRRRVVAQRAARTFSVEDGEYMLLEQIAMPITPDTRIDIGAIVFQGARLNLSEQRLAADMRMLGSQFMLSPGARDFARFGLSEEELRIVEALRTGSSMPALEAVHRDVDPRTMQAIIYSLVACGMCAATSPPRTTTSVPEPDLQVPRAATKMGSGVLPRLAPSASQPPVARTFTPGASPPVAARTPTAPVAARTPTAPAAARTPTAPVAARTPTAPVAARTPTPQGERAPNLPRSLTPASSVGRTPTASRTLTPPSVSRVPTPSEPRFGQGSDLRRSSEPRTPTQSRTATPSEPRTPTQSRTATPSEPRTPTQSRTPTPNVGRAQTGSTPPRTVTRPRSTGPAPTPTRLGTGSGSRPGTTEEPVPAVARTGSADWGEARADATPNTLKAADEAYKRGEKAIKRDDVQTAVQELQQACELNPKHPDYQAVYAWALFCAASDKEKVAADTRKALEKAIHRSDKPEIARFYLGRVERMLGRDREALRQFHEVLVLVPNHAEAASEVRVIEARLAANAKR